MLQLVSEAAIRYNLEVGLQYILGVGGRLEMFNFRLGVENGLESFGVELLELLISSP